MQLNEAVIRNVVQEVLNRLGTNGAALAPVNGKSYQGRFGIFADPNEAVAAAREAFERLSMMTVRTVARSLASSPDRH